MADNQKYAQLQPFSLAGSGAALGATSITLSSMLQIDGTTTVTMSNFGTKGFATIEPGNGTQEEQISFTGITQNANGTATLTGVSTVAFVSPYTETSGTAVAHPGGVTLIISNTAGFYNELTSTANDETITGTWTFTNPNYPKMDTATPLPTDQEQLATKAYVDSVAIAGAPDATTSVQGLLQLPTQAQVDAGTATGSTGAALALTPDLQRSRLVSDYVADTGAADAYAIAPSPAITAYAAGQTFTFKATNANTTASTLNVNGLGVKTIKKASGNDLVSGDIISGQLVVVEYDGTNFQLLSDVAPDTASKIAVQNSSYVYAASSAGTDTYAITVTPTPSAYVTGQVFYMKADVSNTGAATLNVNGLGATPILRSDGSALADGDIATSAIIEVIYNGTNFYMLSPVANSPKYAIGVDTSRNMSSASGDLVIAHGLGRTPRFVRISATIGSGSTTTTFISIGTYIGGTQAAVYSSPTASQDASTGSILLLYSASATPNIQSGVLAVDATNLTITFTKAGSNGTERLNIMWEAQA